VNICENKNDADFVQHLMMLMLLEIISTTDWILIWKCRYSARISWCIEV